METGISCLVAVRHKMSGNAKAITTGCTGSAGKDARLPVTRVLGERNIK